MTFNWINAWKSVVILGAPALSAAAIILLCEGRRAWGIVMAALAFLLVFLAGGIL